MGRMISLVKADMPERIEGEKIILLRRNHDYDSDMFKLIDGSRKFLREFLFWVDGILMPEDCIGTTDMFRQQWDNKESFDYLILKKEDLSLLGAGGIHDIRHGDNAAEFGYFLGKDKTGKGYVSEAVSLLEKLLFEKGFHRLVIECDMNNFASIKVAERAGYKYEGMLKDRKLAYDGYRTHLLFAKINSKGAKND